MKRKNKKTRKEKIQKKEKNHNPKKKDPNHLSKRLKDKNTKKRDNTKTREFWSLSQWPFRQLANQPFSAQSKPITKTFQSTFFHQTRSDCQWWNKRWKRPKVSVDRLHSKSPENRQTKSFTTKYQRFTRPSQSPNKTSTCFWSTRTILRMLLRQELKSTQLGQRSLPICRSRLCVSCHTVLKTGTWQRRASTFIPSRLNTSWHV